jgi:hypothetical protein
MGAFVYYSLGAIDPFSWRADQANVPFSALDTGAGPEDFPNFRRVGDSLAPGTSRRFWDSLNVDKGSLSSGHTDLILDGTIGKDKSGYVYFNGVVRGRSDLYNFDKGGFANIMGKVFAPGRQFWMDWVGERVVKYRDEY